jgi:topoisomerase-4 subunit B
VTFLPDDSIFKHYQFIPEFIEKPTQKLCLPYSGLTIRFNVKRFYSENSLLDLITSKTNPETIPYLIIHLRGPDIEIALTRGNQYGEEYYPFVNGQHTTQGGTHLAVFKEAIKGIGGFQQLQ